MPGDLSRATPMPSATGGGSLLCRNIKVQDFDENTLTLLTTAINEWLESRGEEAFLYIIWNHDHPDYSALIIYIEE